MIAWLLALFGCRHRHTYRERRPVGKLQVMHLVCEDCGRAVPVLARKLHEHRQAVKVGTPHAPKARKKKPDTVTAFRGVR